MRDLIEGVIFVFIGLFVMYWLIPAGVQVPSRMPNPALSPAFWPGIVSGLLIASGALLTIQSGVRLLRFGGGQKKPEVSGEELPVGFLKPALALGLLVPYYLACLYLGLLIPSIFAYVAYAFLAGQRSVPVLLCSGVLLPVAVTLFFVKIANILIPVGPLDGLIR